MKRATAATTLLFSIAYGVHAKPEPIKTVGDRVCHIEASTNAAKKCKHGDILLFVPTRNSSGNTKESIILASLVCDYNFGILQSYEALSCVFTTTRKSQWAEFGME